MEKNFFIFIGIGILAQLIDGALGMAFGVSSTTILLSIGVSPALASASVHAAEIVTTAVSGLSHFSFGNVDINLVKKLLLPGVSGAVIGAYILSNVPGEVMKPIISGYLLIMGIIIIYKAFKKPQPKEVKTHLIPLGLIGGFLDAIGGGGWGPVVVSTLVARGNTPRFSIGSVNLAEFFVALSASVTFFLTLSQVNWQVIAGLAIGGAITAPVAAYVTKRLPTQTLMYLVGILISLLSIRSILLAIL